MSHPPRPTSGLIRPSSGLAHFNQSNTQSSALQARITEKKLELESLKQLRDLSAGLAGQMQQLEEKLSTLSDGTEAVAAVMANWNTVLRAVYMASGEYMGTSRPDNCCVDHGGTEVIDDADFVRVANLPKPKGGDAVQDGEAAEEEIQLPQTLVRIPIQQAEAAQREQQQKRSQAGD